MLWPVIGLVALAKTIVLGVKKIGDYLPSAIGGIRDAFKSEVTKKR